MIARGDLAVELGYERLGEVQEEILWLAEAACRRWLWCNPERTGRLVAQYRD